MIQADNRFDESQELSSLALSQTFRARKGERVLLVDDDLLVLKSTGRILVRLGYRVTECHSAAIALDTFENASEPFDLMITDQVMPRMTGLELSEIVHEQWPELPILLMSSSILDLRPEVFCRSGIQTYIEKPFVILEFDERIRLVLG